MRITHILLVVALLGSWVLADAERFVPAGGSLQLKTDASIYGVEVKLKQVCQWAEADEKQFGAIGELVVGRVEGETTKIRMGELRAMLKDAGVDMSAVRFRGAVECLVTRSGAGVEETKVAAVPATQAVEVQAKANQGPVVTLKERLTADLAGRLGLGVEVLQMAFNGVDDKVLALAEPQFKFEIEPRRVRNLGSVGWDVKVIGEGVEGKKMMITATARAWQDELVANRPVSGRQVIRDEDVIEKRALVDQMPDGELLKREQVVGQQASFDLKPGVLMTSRMVQAVPLVRAGQVLTVVLNTGGVEVRTVGKAVDEGTFGQTIRVRNEGTKEIYEAVMTGPGVAEISAGRKG